MSAEGWQILAEFLQPAVSLQTDYTLEQLMNDIALGTSQAWALLVEDEDEPVGAVATQVVTYPSGLVGCEILAGSTQDTDLSWDSMRSVIATIEEFAADNGADVVRILGRRGWQKILPDYTLEYVCIGKRVREMAS